MRFVSTAGPSCSNVVSVHWWWMVTHNAWLAPYFVKGFFIDEPFAFWKLHGMERIRSRSSTLLATPALTLKPSARRIKVSCSLVTLPVLDLSSINSARPSLQNPMTSGNPALPFRNFLFRVLSESDCVQKPTRGSFWSHVSAIFCHSFSSTSSSSSFSFS